MPLRQFLLAQFASNQIFEAWQRLVNLSGRKSNVRDCQWLQKRMTYGLLHGAFRPAEAVCVLRALWRQRGLLLCSQGRHVQHKQKALTQKNL